LQYVSSYCLYKGRRTSQWMSN